MWERKKTKTENSGASTQEVVDGWDHLMHAIEVGGEVA